MVRSCPDHAAWRVPAQEAERLLQIPVCFEAYLESEDVSVFFRLEREVNQIEKRFPVDLRAIVIQLELARHREHADRQIALLHRFQKGRSEQIVPDRRRKQEQSTD